MRPVLVGIDPGQGDEPLPGSSKVGARLADLAGMRRADFDDAFDRVNLYSFPFCPRAGIDDDQRRRADIRAVKNLSPLLRGRRVVLLGRRVAEAFGAPLTAPGQHMAWDVQTTVPCVVASLPHPSGLNRWWNDPANDDAARRFMSRVRAPTVVVEGPDGAGKTTLVSMLAERLPNLERVKRGLGPPTLADIERRVAEGIRPGALSDRFPALSGRVYGALIGGEQLSVERAATILRAVSRSVLFVYCRPDRGVIKSNNKFKPGEDASFAAKVDERIDRIVDMYDELVSGIEAMGTRVLRYDWVTMNPSYVANWICAAS